jgi:hypothetical protein
VRDTEDMFKLIENIKKVPENINPYIPIYFGAGIGTGDIEFSEKYEMPIERAGQEIVIDMKNSARP